MVKCLFSQLVFLSVVYIKTHTKAKAIMKKVCEYSDGKRDRYIHFHFQSKKKSKKIQCAFIFYLYKQNIKIEYLLFSIPLNFTYLSYKKKITLQG